MVNLIEITENNFEEEIYDSKVPVLLDFYSDGCIACERIDKEIQSIANKYNNKLKIARLNIDECRAIAVACEIQCTPTILLWVEGDIVDIIEGFKNSRILQEHVNYHTQRTWLPIK